MKAPEKIEILNQQLQEIDALLRENAGTSGSIFVRWRAATRRRIERIFGEQTQYLKQFDSIRYSSNVIVADSSEQRRIDSNAYARGLVDAKNLLLVMIDELSETPQEESAPDVSRAEMAFIDHPFPELAPFLSIFKKDHPDSARCAFIMMQFTDTRLHGEIVDTIRTACAAHGVAALRADDKSYSDDLLPNVRTYMHGCGLGIAIFERLTSEVFNPNVSLEVGYMMALRKPTLLLKDTTLASLHTDLVGRLYRPFDTQNPRDSLPPVIERWLQEKFPR